MRRFDFSNKGSSSSKIQSLLSGSSAALDAIIRQTKPKLNDELQQKAFAPNIETY